MHRQRDERTVTSRLGAVEIICLLGFGDDVSFAQRLGQSAEIQQLKAVGVAVVVSKE
jgi:hypothetical protein